GVETSYFRPDAGSAIEDDIRPETRLVFLESPGSYTFEIQDIPAITAVCRHRGVLTAIDNTWASPLYFKPLDHGVDISTQAATKYICGHSDVMMGSIAVNDEALYRTIKDTVIQFGNNVSPADCYLALRGMRTMGVRLRQHHETALRLVEWLAERPEVDEVLYPAWPNDPGHEIWKRDFHGATGLFGVVLKPASKKAVAALVDGMTYFRIGASWGGYESLMIPSYPTRSFATPPWSERGPLLRLHAGLEDPRDLIEDLEKGLGRLNAV
ncbi:MAG: PLP-dependent transferase, partial [Alphaproteobacteria bacterium]|nr:PLP-dependent transferase [Alphaproteobacteria bacterium]